LTACFDMTFDHNAEDASIAIGNLGCFKKSMRKKFLVRG
jgi:hypothetical protein